MSNNNYDNIFIRITQRRKELKILGMSIPFFSYIITNGVYSPQDGIIRGNESGDANPLNCLVNILVNTEMNRGKRQIKNVNAVFELIGDWRSYGPAMTSLVKMYARSEQADVTFEYNKG